MPPPAPSEPALFGLDIETDTAVDGLDPTVASVVAAAVCDGEVDHVLLGDERDLLRRLDELLASLPDGLLVTWNGAAFDLPFLAHRAAATGVELGLEIHPDLVRRSAREPDRQLVRARWHRLVHLDGYQLYRADVGRSLGLSCGLKALSRLAGMEPVELDCAELHLASPEDLTAYVASDARLAVELVNRRMPSAAGAADFPQPPSGALRSDGGHPERSAGQPGAHMVGRT